MAADKIKEAENERKCRELIDKGQFYQAARIMEEYRTPLHDYMGKGPLNLDHDLEAIYKMYEKFPEQLRNLSAEYYVPARKELAYEFLRGNNTIRKYMNKPTNIPGMTVGIAMIIMLNRACQLRDIDRYKNSGVCIGVEIIAAGDMCPECKKICGKYSWNDDIPALPNPKCKKSSPCLPIMNAIVGVEKPTKKKGLFGLF